MIEITSKYISETTVNAKEEQESIKSKRMEERMRNKTWKGYEYGGENPENNPEETALKTSLDQVRNSGQDLVVRRFNLFN